MKTYICNKRVSKAGKLYQVGEEIQLTSEQAKNLPVALKKMPKTQETGNKE